MKAEVSSDAQRLNNNSQGYVNWKLLWASGGYCPFHSLIYWSLTLTFPVAFFASRDQNKSFSSVSLMAQMKKNLPAMQETWAQSLGQEDPLEKERATHSSILAWKFHGQSNLAGYNSWGTKESKTTE